MTVVTVRLIPIGYGSLGSEMGRWFSDSGHNVNEIVAFQDGLYDLEKSELSCQVFVLDKEGRRTFDKPKHAEGEPENEDEVVYKKKDAKLKMVPIGAYGVL